MRDAGDGFLPRAQIFEKMANQSRYDSMYMSNERLWAKDGFALRAVTLERPQLTRLNEH